MKPKRRIAVLATLAILLSLTAGFALAQASNPAESPQPQSPQETNAMVDRAFTYQGVLKEDGQPVTGTRTMDFLLHSNATCTSQMYDLTMPNVPVSNGLFSVELPVQSYVFDGDAVWIQVKVNGEALGCQKVTAAPYALSLAPGSIVKGAIASGPVLQVRNEDYMLGSAIGATTWAREGTGLLGEALNVMGVSYGVQGLSKSPDGYGVMGVNPGGVALGAQGAIQSTADSVLILSPHDLVLRANDTALDAELPDMTVLPLDGGGVRVRNASVPLYDIVYFSIPMSTFGTLLGSQMYVKGVEVCYAASNTQIIATAVMKNTGTATGYDFYLIDLTTGRNATTRTCYTLKANMPYKPIDNSSWVQFNVKIMGTFPPVSLDIYTVKVTLTQFASD